MCRGAKTEPLEGKTHDCERRKCHVPGVYSPPPHPIL